MCVVFRVGECRPNVYFNQHAHINRTDTDGANKAVMTNCGSDNVIASSYPTRNKNVCSPAQVWRCDQTPPPPHLPPSRALSNAYNNNSHSRMSRKPWTKQRPLEQADKDGATHTCGAWVYYYLICLQRTQRRF